MRSVFGREQKTYANGDHKSSNMFRALIDGRCFKDVDGVGDVNDSARLFVRTARHSYHKLPQQLLKLSVLKLDGSSFDVHVGRNATIAEVKQAVEEVFMSSPKEGQDKISWSHVWGHFCLCYERQKLINDKACIRNFGIKDGDQLQFVRHISLNYSSSKRQSQSRNQHAARKPFSLPSSGYVHEEKEQKNTADHSEKTDKQDYNSTQHDENEKEIPESEFKLSHFLKGWLSYSKLWGSSRRGSQQGQSRPSRFALQFLGGGSRMIKLQG